MTFTELIDKINQFIIANNNREITADVLNPILKDIANYFSVQVGDLNNSGVNGDDVIEKINTLNGLISQINGLNILNGETDPNNTPPLFYNIGDFYIQSVNSLILGLFVFNGTEWANIKNWINDSVTSDVLTWSSEKIVNYINNRNELISTNGYLLTDSSITFYAGARWRINNVIYTNQNDITIPIPIASPDNYRTDLYVGNESGLIVRIAGTESTTIQAPPSLPTNTVAVTESTTYGNSTAIQPAPNLDGLKSKLESGIVYFNDSGVLDSINLVGQESHIYLNNATELKSIQVNNGYQPYDGKQLILTNNNTTDVIIRNNSTGQDIYSTFIFPNNADYTLKPKESIVFYYSLLDGKFYFLSSNISSGGSNQMIRAFYPSWNLTTLNTWKCWSRNTSNMLSTDANTTAGTGEVPMYPGVTLADSNYVLLHGAKKIKRVILSFRQVQVANMSVQFILKSFNQVNGTNGRGAEANQQVLINESFTMANNTSYGYLKSDFIIANHELSDLTGLVWSYRCLENPGTPLGVNLIIECE